VSALTLLVNGTARTVDLDDPNEPLLYVLRTDLGLHGTKFGCGLGQCGACTVLVGGRPVRSCVTPAQAAAGRDVTTIEGLGSPAQPDPVQAAFIAEAAAQCGYCTAGMVVAARALLRETPHPNAQQIREALAGNLCRCGSHPRVIRAIMRAAAAGGR
jgi:nicotinate dehydrogenase subunit A